MEDSPVKMERDEKSGKWTVAIESLPDNFEQIEALFPIAALKPEGAVALFLYAFKIYSEDEMEGLQAFSLILDHSLLQSSHDRGNHNGMLLGKRTQDRLKQQIGANSGLTMAYFKGAKPENKYTPEAPPYIVEMHTNPYSGEESAGRLKLFVGTEGADSDRPVQVKQGIDKFWRVSNFSSLIVGIQ